MKKYNDLSLLILRLVFGGFMLFSHGWGKMIKLFTGDPTKFADPIGLGAPVSLSLAVFSEVLCAALILIGYLTRWAAIPLIITMLIAATIIHGADSFGDKESALIYLAGYVAIFLAGPGKYSLDSKLRGL